MKDHAKPSRWLGKSSRPALQPVQRCEVTVFMGSLKYKEVSKEDSGKVML